MENKLNLLLEYFESKRLVSPSRKRCSALVGFGLDFLAKNKVTTLEHPPHSLDLASADLFSVPSTEINIEGTALL
jgi:hypothetical protein